LQTVFLLNSILYKLLFRLYCDFLSILNDFVILFELRVLQLLLFDRGFHQVCTLLFANVTLDLLQF